MTTELPPEYEMMSARSVNKQRRVQGARSGGLAEALHLPTGADGLISPSEWQGVPIPQREWIVQDILPVGTVTMLSGEGGTGKSHIAMQLLVSAATGSPWLGQKVANVPTLGVHCEDDPDELQRRLGDILAAQGSQFSDLENWVTLLSRMGMDNIMYSAGKYDEDGSIQPFLTQVKQLALKRGARLVVLDSLYNVFGGNEISRPQASAFINALGGLANDINGVVLLLAHPSMSGISSGSGTSGSTAWHNAVRSRLYLYHRKCKAGEVEDEFGRGPFVLESKKSNYGARPAEIQVERKNGVFVNQDREPEWPREGLETPYQSQHRRPYDEKKAPEPDDIKEEDW